jgi:hypothetical protein
MLRAFVILLLMCCATLGIADDTSAIKFPSPDGRFALRVQDLKVDLIEITTGNVMFDLGTLFSDPDVPSSREQPLLVWSGDSKWVAYGATFGQFHGSPMSGKTTLYFFDGSAFKRLALPAKLPEPKIKPREGDSGVKLKGYAEEPLKWTKPGELELSSKLTGMGRDVGFDYTASIVITVAFDAHHRASVKNVTATKTEVSE